LSTSEWLEIIFSKEVAYAALGGAKEYGIGLGEGVIDAVKAPFELLELFVRATDLAVNDPDGFKEVTGQVLTALGQQETYQAVWNGIVADITTSRGIGHMAGDAVVTMTVAGMLRNLLKEGSHLAKSIEFLDESLLRKYWKREVEFDGVKVYQRDDLFDVEAMTEWREKGNFVKGTNLEAMKRGNAPVGTDGKSVNLHHSIQADEGPIVEVLDSMHREYRELIHVNIPHTDFKSGINRSKFDTWRQKYWKARAEQIEKGLE